MGAIAADFAAIRAVPPIAGRNNGLAKRVWLLLYTEGGRWTGEEIAARLHMARPLWSALGEMARDGFLERVRVTNVDGEVAVKFLVTRTCKVPRGVTIDEMWEVLQIGAKQ